MPRSRDTLTYRLRRLPAYLKRSTVADYLVRSVEGLGPPDNIVVFSLASNSVQWERPPTRVATLRFKKTPERFDNDRTEWTLHVADQDQSLIFDTHFLDFTPLSDPGHDLHQLDCIAISGLASHPLGSWMQRNPDNEFVWLRDRLPRDIPAIRPIIYGYDTQLLKSESIQTIDDLASSFIAKLKAVGRASDSAKPLVILAHSLGGILLRSALIQMASSGDEENCILSSIKMVFFFGVPTRGMHMSHLLSMVKGQPNETLIQLLSPNSDYLSSLNCHFSGIAQIRTIRLVYAYETKLSRTTQISNNGIWERTGPYELLVSKQSAVQADSDHRNCFPINEDHSNMVKLADDSSEYRIVLGLIDSIVEKSLTTSPASGTFSPSVDGGVAHGQRSHKPKRFKFPKGRKQRPTDVSLTNQPRTDFQPSPDKLSVQGSQTRGTPQDEASERQKIIKELHDSLSFEDRTQRYHTISQAHQTTFDWAFENPKLGLVSWLRKGSGVYWIRGKPGSGKSTLMKFLHDDYRMSEILSRWRQGRGQTSAWFFFNERGSPMEKSFEGLLRVVIEELISTNKSVEEIVLNKFRSLKKVRRSQQVKEVWHAQDLEDALSEIVSQREQDLDVLLLLDALDEFSGPPEMIAEFIQSLVEPVPGSKTKVKILFSSRPWDAFVAGFGRHPGFKMHEQTKGDLRVFAFDELAALHSTTTPLPQAIGPVHARSGDIVSLIVDRAEGVFLWVRLIVESLLQAGPDKTIHQLEELVRTFPNGLEELYERTLERIPRSSRLEAFVVIELVNRAVRKRPLRELVLASSCALGKTVQECCDMVKLKGEDLVVEQEALQLKNLCGGIIEINHLGPEPTVQFIHQTVKDFVSRPGFEHRMLSRYHAPLYENGFSFWMKYELARFELWAGYGSKDDGTILYLFSDLARLSEETTGNDSEEFLDSMSGKFCRALLERLSPIFCPVSASALQVAVASGLLLYTRRALRTTHIAREAAPEYQGLLHLAVEAETLRSLEWSARASMIRLLLEHGADLQYKVDNLTAFAYFVSQMTQGSQEYGTTRGKIADVVRAFLENGQDPNIDVGYPVVELHHYVCKPLHLVAYQACDALLQHGAHVNALDSSGKTALDHIIQSAAHNDRGQVCETASTLLKHGGCITYSTKKSLPSFLTRITVSGEEIPQKLRNPPMLPSKLMQRLWGVLPSFTSGQ